MDKEENIKELIQSIQQVEGANFQYNESAIFDEYKKEEANTTSLAIKILSILGGFLATLAFLGFLLIAGLYKSDVGLVATGIFFIISAIWMNKIYDKLIYDTLSISTYVIGFCLIGFGFTQLDIDDNIITFIFLIIAITSLIVNQTYILSFISVLIIGGSLIAQIMMNDLHYLIHLYTIFTAFLMSYLFLNEAKIITTNSKLSKLYNPFRIGLIFSLIFGLNVSVNSVLFEISTSFIWVSSIAPLILVIYIVSQVVKMLNITDKKSQLIIYGLSILVLSSTIFAPSILGAILIILLSFLVNYKTGLVIGIVSLIYFVSQYYYDLNLTLLTKSIILFSSGLLFLTFYIIIHKKSRLNEKV